MKGNQRLWDKVLIEYDDEAPDQSQDVAGDNS